MKILVGVPLHALNGSYRFRDCLEECMRETSQGGHQIMLSFAPSSMLPTNRNSLVKNAIKNEAEYIMMFDCDQTFQPDIILELLSHEKPVVSGLYHTKTFPFQPLMLKKVTKTKYSPILHWEPDSLVACDGIGGGGMLIDMDIFDKIPKPWFACPPSFMYYDGITGKFMLDRKLYRSKDYDQTTVAGEDLWFCRLVRESGFEIFVDTSLKMGHIGEHIFDYQEFEGAYADGGFAAEEKQYGGDTVCKFQQSKLPCGCGSGPKVKPPEKE